jgi:hypothetical protein
MVWSADTVVSRVSTRTLMAMMVAALAAPVFVAAQTLEAPSGTGPLPDLQAGAKSGALVTKGYIDKYRGVIPPELAELVDRNEFAFEAVLRPKSPELLADGQESPTTNYSLDDKGSISPPPVSVSSALFGVPQTDEVIGSQKNTGWKILWNTTVALWKLKSLSASISLVTFAPGSEDGKRVDFTVSRIYPPALGQSPGTLKPMFREKISAVNPQPLLGLTWLTLRFLGTVQDYMWAASPINGEVRQMTGSNRGDLMFAGAFAPDDLFVWSGKVEGVEPTSVKLVKMLIPVVEGGASVQPSNNEVCGSADFTKTSPITLNFASRRFADLPGWIPTNVRMTLRNLWRVEMMSRDPFSPDARQILYVDADTMLPVYRVVWEQDGRMKKFIMGILGNVPSKAGSAPGWRSQIAISPGTGARAVLTLQRLETCAQLITGKNIIDFDPSRIGAKSSKSKSSKASEPQPDVEAEPVDE